MESGWPDPVEPFGITLNRLMAVANECGQGVSGRGVRDHSRRCLESHWSTEVVGVPLRLKRYRNENQSRDFVLSGREWLFQFRTHVGGVGVPVVFDSTISSDSGVRHVAKVKFHGNRDAMLRDMVLVKLGGTFSDQPLDRRWV